MKPQLSEAVIAFLTDNDRPVRELADFVGVSESMMGIYLGDNEWPDDADRIARLCEFLGLSIRTRVEVEANYQAAGWKPARTRNRGRSGGAFAELEGSPRVRNEGDTKVNRMIARMGGRHVLAVTTQTVIPAPFRPDEMPEQVQLLQGAVGRGLLVAFVVPTNHHVHHLEQNYKYERRSLHQYQEFADAFGVLMDGCQPGEAGGGAELFACEEFPVTPCGRIVTLAGEVDSYGHVELRVLERGPGDSGGVTIPPRHHTTEHRVRLFVEAVMERDAQINKPSEARAEFVRRFCNRMHGLRD